MDRIATKGADLRETSSSAAAGQLELESDLRFRAVAQSVNDGVITADYRGVIIFWNQSAQDVFGYTEQEVLGQPLSMLMPERYREAHRTGFERLKSTGKGRVIGTTVELDGLRKDGSEFPLELSLGSWREGDKRFYTGVIRDITARRRADRYLSAQQAVTRVLAESDGLEDVRPRLLEAIGEAMGWDFGSLWRLDRVADVLRCDAVWRGPGLAPGTFEAATRDITFERGVGLPGRVWETGQPAWIRDVMEDSNFPRRPAAAEQGLHGAVALPILRGQEVLGVVEFFSADIREADGALTDMMSTISVQLAQFFRRRARTAAELQRRAADLERANAELEQFAYVASHDLSEPLRTVSGFVQLLANRYRGRLDADADEFIGYTVEGVERMQALIRDLLAFSRTGRDPHAEVDCSAVVNSVLDALAPAIEEAGATIEVGELPTVHGDPTALGQLFQNLLSNALKFRNQTPPRVRIVAHRERSAWRFTVSDNGIGIEPRHAERVFKMFQRLHGRDRYPGTGIGLAVCKKIVERHGGRIWVEPAAGGGSALRFTISSELEDPD